MAKLKEITLFLDELLKTSEYSNDCSNNGLQVEGDPEVSKAVFGVDACGALFDQAVDKDADFIFVHHGLSWGGGIPSFRGITAERFRTLFCNGISLYASHLPLDSHPEFGHNARLADFLGLEKREPFYSYSGYHIGFSGTLSEDSTPMTVAEHLSDILGGDFQIFGDGEKKIRTLGIVSGGGGFESVIEAVKKDLDCLVTGEISHTFYHIIRESGVPVIALGHYSSETPGVKAVMEILSEQFEIECEFVDIPTGL